MGTITKTYKEIGSGTKAAWTVVYGTSSSTYSLTGTGISIPCTLSVKHDTKSYAVSDVTMKLSVNGSSASNNCHQGYGSLTSFETSNFYKYSWSANTEKTASNNLRFVAGQLFDSNNADQSEVSVLCTADINVKSCNGTGGSPPTTQTNLGTYSAEGVSVGTIATIKFNVPPTVSSSSFTKDTPSGYYAGLTTVTAHMSALAKYGGTISKVKLTVGSQSAERDGNGSVSLRLANAGEQTATLTATDSRGQTVTRTYSFTAQQYLAPSVSFDVFRTDASGVRDDEGTNAVIEARLSYSEPANLTAPTVNVTDQNGNAVATSVTWYSAYDEDTGVGTSISDWSTVESGAYVYGLVSVTNSEFDTTKTYTFALQETDTEGTPSIQITQTLSTAFYTIDVKAGGKEIAFGKPANDTLTQNQEDIGLFKCNMDTAFNDMTQQEVEDFIDNLNVGTGGGLAVDLVVEQGTTGIWTYRKWNSGLAECWGRTSVPSATYTANGGSKNVVENLPSGLFNATPSVVEASGRIQGLVQTMIGFTAPNSATQIQTYLVNRGGSAVTNVGYVDWNIKGTWK